MHSCTVWEETLCDGSSAFSTKKLWENIEEITNSKKRKREIRNQKLRKARQAKFEKRQRVEKISQFRRVTDLQNNLRKEMYELATIAHRQYSRSKYISYPNRLVCLTIIINPLYTSINSPLQVYETYLTDNIIYYCAIGGCKAGSLNQKICLSVTESNFKACLLFDPQKIDHRNRF